MTINETARLAYLDSLDNKIAAQTARKATKVAWLAEQPTYGAHELNTVMETAALDRWLAEANGLRRKVAEATHLAGLVVEFVNQSTAWISAGRNGATNQDRAIANEAADEIKHLFQWSGIQIATMNIDA